MRLSQVAQVVQCMETPKLYDCNIYIGRTILAERCDKERARQRWLYLSIWDRHLEAAERGHQEKTQVFDTITNLCSSPFGGMNQQMVPKSFNKL